MKISTKLVIFFLLTSLFSGLTLYSADYHASTGKKVWVFFKDKGDNFKNGDLSKLDKNYVTEASKERRIIKGCPVVTILDVPVNSHYIDKVKESGAKVRNVSKWLNAVSVYATNEQIKALSVLPFVLKVSDVSVGRSEIDLLPADDLSKAKSFFADSSEDLYEYGPNCENQIKMLGVDKLHNIGYTGRDVRIALFDTGLLMTSDSFTVDNSVTPPETTWLKLTPMHSALKMANIITSYDFVNDYPFAGIREGGTSDEVRQLDHGTKMLGLIAGYERGELVSPAFGADFLIAKTEIVDSEIIAEEDNWIRAVEWADSLGADIISSSLGYKDWYPYSVMTGDSTNIAKAANIASDSFGMVVVNSIGNIKNIDIDRPDTMIASPADAYSVIAVGGVDDNLLHSTVSATGPTYDVFIDTLGLNPIRYKPDICALAEWPYTVSDAEEGFNFTLGTSGAAALISAGCALIIQAHPNWSPSQVREALYASGYAPFSATEPETTYFEIPNQTVGYGIADFYSAVMYADTEEVHAIEESRILPPYPNPFPTSGGMLVIPFELKRTISNLQLYIYTLDGKLVYYSKKTNLLPGVYDKIDNSFTWNGIPALDEYSFSGYTNTTEDKKVRPGVYIIMLQTGFEKTVKKISIIP